MAPRLLAALLVVFTTYIPAVVAQTLVFRDYRDCPKYCRGDCGDNSWGFRDLGCAGAEDHCSCHAEVSDSGLFGIFCITVIVVVITYFCVAVCQVCFKCCRHTPRVPHRVVAHIVVPAPVVTAIVNNSRSSPTATSNNNTTAQGGLPGFVQPPFVPQKPVDYPPEYLPPPPYNECVIDINSPENAGRASTKN